MDGEEMCEIHRSDFTDSVKSNRVGEPMSNSVSRMPLSIFLSPLVWALWNRPEEKAVEDVFLCVCCRHFLSTGEIFFIYLCTVLQHGKELVSSTRVSNIFAKQ